jgi:hypothetical protein
MARKLSVTSVSSRRATAVARILIKITGAGTSEDWRPDYSSFQDVDKGSGLPDWHGEKWLDIRSASVWAVMANRIKMASDKGCDAIDPDNMGKLYNI